MGNDMATGKAGLVQEPVDASHGFQIVDVDNQAEPQMGIGYGLEGQGMFVFG